MTENPGLNDFFSTDPATDPEDVGTFNLENPDSTAASALSYMRRLRSPLGSTPTSTVPINRRVFRQISERQEQSLVRKLLDNNYAIPCFTSAVSSFLLVNLASKSPNDAWVSIALGIGVGILTVAGDKIAQRFKP